MTNFPFRDETQLRDVESLNLLAQARKDGREAWAWNGIRKKAATTRVRPCSGMLPPTRASQPERRGSM